MKNIFGKHAAMMLVAALVLALFAPQAAKAQYDGDEGGYQGNNGWNNEGGYGGQGGYGRGGYDHGRPHPVCENGSSQVLLSDGSYGCDHNHVLAFANSVGIGTAQPMGTLDIENGKGTATLCLNGNCESSLGTASLGEKGYQTFPSGLIMQWGRTYYIESDGEQGTLDQLPIAFPNSCFRIVASDCGNGAHSVGASCGSNVVDVWGRVNDVLKGTCVSWVAYGN